MRTAVITGGNRGLGYECARHLARDPDWNILIACRDPQEAQPAVTRLRQATSQAAIEAWPLDLASLASIHEFVAAVQSSDRPPLGALVCNAGLQVVSGTQRTRDGFEVTFGVNHLGHFLLVNRLLDRLVPPARIVLVSSGTHDPAMKSGMPEPEYTGARTLAFPQDDGQGDPVQIGGRRYTTSKLANVLMTYELARRLDEQGRTGITVNAFDPGLMPGTGLARDYNLISRLAWKYVLPFVPLFGAANRVEDSGAALARLILAPELAHVTGKYFVGQAMKPSSAESYDRAKAAELWATSAELVGLASSGPAAVSEG